MSGLITSAHVIGGTGLGGAENFYIRLVNALYRRGQPVFAINVRGGRISAALQPDIPQEHAPMLSTWDLLSRWRIRRIVGRHRPDVVQTYIGRATRLTHLPRGRRPVHVARLGGYYNLKGYRHAHAWIGNTKGICDHLIKGGLPAERVCHVGNFVTVPEPTPPEALAALRRQLDIPEEALVVVGIGRLHPVKGFEDLLEAVSRLPPALYDRPLYLVIVGDGPLNDKLRRHGTELGLDRRLRWTGWRTDTDIFYDLADLFVCPSRYEPLGNVVLESWVHRRPLLATRSAGALELAVHEDTAWLVPLEDPAAMAEAIRRLLGDDGLRARLAENGYRRVIAHHSADAVVEAYLDFYGRLLKM